MTEPINPKDVVAAVEADRLSGELSRKVTTANPVYQLAKDRPGMVERIFSDGRKEIGLFENGAFIKTEEVSS